MPGHRTPYYRHVIGVPSPPAASSWRRQALILSLHTDTRRCARKVSSGTVEQVTSNGVAPRNVKAVPSYRTPNYLFRRRGPSTSLPSTSSGSTTGQVDKQDWNIKGQLSVISYQSSMAGGRRRRNRRSKVPMPLSSPWPFDFAPFDKLRIYDRTSRNISVLSVSSGLPRRSHRRRRVVEKKAVVVTISRAVLCDLCALPSSLKLRSSVCRLPSSLRYAVTSRRDKSFQLRPDKSS